MLRLLLILIACCQLMAQAELPAGEGKSLVEAHCTKCHGAEAITRSKNSLDSWNATVDDMVSRGVKAPDDDIERIVAYLFKHFSQKAEVNKASAKDLAEALDLTPAEAAAIVQFREKTGRFESIQDLKKVPGLDTTKLEARKSQLLF